MHYGTNPKDLSQTAKSPIRLNPDHPETVSKCAYKASSLRQPYYKVDSMEANGKGDRVKSTVKHFTTLIAQDDRLLYLSRRTHNTARSSGAEVNSD